VTAADRCAHSEIGLGRVQAVPVGRRLHAEAFDTNQLPLDAQQLLDEALGLLVAAFAKVLVADDAVRVGEVKRRSSMRRVMHDEFLAIVC
jgi:hypothetical protein